MRRTAISIPANIAEGSGKKSQKEYLHFLQTALSSATELDHYIYLVKDLGFIQIESFEKIRNDTQQVIKMLQWLIYQIERDIKADG